MPDQRGAKPWFFDAWSSFYDEAFVQRSIYQPVHDAVVDVLRRTGPHERVLDLACGTGLLTARLRQDPGVVEIMGADYSAGMLEQASRRQPDIAWVRASAMALPFADASFNAITSTEAFHWFPDQSLALRECLRVLRPGGRLLVALVHPDYEIVSVVARELSKLAGQPLRWPSTDAMRELLEREGFVVEEQRRIPRFFWDLLLPPVLSVARRAG